MGMLGKLVWCVDAKCDKYGLSGIVRGFDGERYLVLFDDKRAVLRRNQFVVA